MSENTPDIRTKLDSLADRIELKNIRESIQSLSTRIEQKLPGTVKSLRARGYEFQAYIDEAVDELEQRWSDAKDELEARIREETQELRQHFSSLSEQLKKLLDSEKQDDAEKPDSRRLKLSREDANEPEAKESRLAGRMRSSKATDEDETAERRLKLSRESEGEGEDLFGKVERNLDALAERIEMFESQVESRLSDLTKNESELSREANVIDWYLKHFEEAGFSLQSGESLVMAAKAEWLNADQNDPDGVLYLTNKRLIFEQKEKVNKRFGLFGGQKVQDVVWEFEVNFVENLEHENKGLFGGKDIMHITISEGAPTPVITVEVKGGADNAFWVKRIQQVVSGEIEKERVQPS